MGIRIGIVGAGTTVAIADRHVEGFLAQAGRCTVTAVCSRTLEGCRRLCIRHGLDGVRMTTRLEELLAALPADDASSLTGAALEAAGGEAFFGVMRLRWDGWFRKYPKMPKEA